MTDTTSGQAFYKGFDKNMQCRDFQYAEGKTYVHEGRVNVCHSGFHACALPLDVLTYYPLRDGNCYHAVTLDGVAEPEGGDSKVAGRKITIGASVNVFGLVKAHVEAIWKRATEEKEALGAHAATTGYRANAATTGDRANAATTGYRANAATTGRWAHAATTGDGAHAATTGDGAHAAATGDRANAATTGYHSAATVSGKDSIAVVTGYESKARGARGCWIVLTERDPYSFTIKEVRAVCVDGETVKAGVFYVLQDGELVEVGE